MVFDGIYCSAHTMRMQCSNIAKVTGLPHLPQWMQTQVLLLPSPVKAWAPEGTTVVVEESTAAIDAQPARDELLGPFVFLDRGDGGNAVNLSACLGHLGRHDQKSV